MEAYNEQGLESPSRNSYIGSYYQPPDRMIPLPRRVDFPFHIVEDSVSPTASHRGSHQSSNIDSTAVVEALKTLQEKIQRTEAETSRHTEKSRQVFHEAHNQPSTVLTTLPIIPSQQKTDNDPVIRCKMLQKQLELTKRNIERAKKERSTLLENQNTLYKEEFTTNVQLQKEKLEKLESEYEKLNRTQTVAQIKLTRLEEKIRREEHERKLVQEKADELQREFDSTLRRGTDESKSKTKAKKTKNTQKQNKKSPVRSLSQTMPFVAGTSTSPSHSVHANIQGVLHMMKHHQPHLHERVVLLHKSWPCARKSLQKDLYAANCVLQRHNSDRGESEESLASLSDLLVSLQDDLGQMSFQHQELKQQIDISLDQNDRRVMINELERLVTKMEEKGAHITKLRKHQHMVHKIHQQPASRIADTQKTTVIDPPAPTLVKPRKRAQKQPGAQNNLVLLRETKQFTNSLKQCDLSWES
ncbi:centrosomal protein CEP57L1 [Eucyclogobius newberryi]|uniref:centrosomal protein CEP57L1 n=1 Tax=Eucyclogobius newberryi TaxID=166745 RepID=UPI003B5A8345